MGKKPVRKKAVEKENNELLASLEFLALIKTDETTALFRDGQLVATDGVVTIGVPVDTSLNACPNLHKTLNALRICGREFQLTQLTDRQIEIKNNNFRAKIECIEPALSPAMHIKPDAAQWGLNNHFIEALMAVAPIAVENATRLVETTILCKDSTVIASDGKVLMQLWHGLPFPNVVFPKQSAILLSKTKKEIQSFGVGYNQDGQLSSITFHFTDKSWLKTQLYVESWPELSHVLDAADLSQPTMLPPEFFDAVNNVAKFTEEGKPIWLLNTMVACGGASQTLTAAIGINDIAFNPRYVRFFTTYVEKIAYSEKVRALYFFGKLARAVVMTMR